MDYNMDVKYYYYDSKNKFEIKSLIEEGDHNDP